jgi:hypothetical protein
VNRNDLEDLLYYDTSALTFGGFGMFLVSGSVWILVGQFFSQPSGSHTMTTLMYVCTILLLIGAFPAYQGNLM